MTVLMVQDMLIARSPWFSVLVGMTQGFHKRGLALYPKILLGNSNGFVSCRAYMCKCFYSAFNAVCEIAKFGAVFWFSHLSLYMSTVKLDQFFFGSL